ncbi:hypothetical protein BB561_004639 [Smittium simulii]|uniref:FAM192A/Fyv6 N-terminal domain-containing protein n=1 Tax=Smittium simulii TaxID=133385 RepID=A0A2T9YF68_9FUNG|nr:hypothetical protein BB561_004639 [Smittium simulii]
MEDLKKEISLKFVSKDTIDEINKLKPEGGHASLEYDPRTLYEKLQEQKVKKDEQLKEASKFSISLYYAVCNLGNLIHRIDDEEYDFLQNIQSEARKQEEDKLKEERRELENFRRHIDANIEFKATKPSSPVLFVQSTKDTGAVESKAATTQPHKLVENKLKRTLGLISSIVSSAAPKKNKPSEPSPSDNLSLLAMYSDASSDSE